MKENLFLKLSIFCFLFIGLSSLNSKLYSGNYVVSGAGTTDVNGTYVETGTCSGGFPRYVFVNGSNTFVIISDGYNWYIGEENGSCNIDFFSVKYQISSTASLPPASGWATGSYGGSYPVPSVASQSSTINITSFSPSTGPVGTLVTISGTDLSSPTAFTIGGVPAIVISNNGTTLVGMVMPGATTGAISVTTGGGNAISSSNFMVIATPYPNTQQSNKLVGTGNTGNPYHGRSVAISADGNTAIVGAPYDDANKGAAWIYTRTGSIWSQQGDKLVGTGAVGAANQGGSVSLSADGNTAIVGGFADNTNKGAVWIFTRSANIWAQQGSKLVGTGATTGYAARQGISVSLSADGNTAAVGGKGDNSTQGAVWVFIRTGNSWAQQGAKLVVTAGISYAILGSSIALSSDGNTLITGGTGENSGEGAAWIFTRSAGVWSQQSKLVGTGSTSDANQGSSVDLSADGNTAIVGGWANYYQQGAAWVFTRSTGTWSQQAKLVAGSGAAYQGESVALSADGNTALVGGSYDNASVGATWVYTRSGSIWSQQGSKLVGTGGGGSTIQQGKSTALSADGYTAIIGGPNDSYGNGAVWVFTPAPPCANPSSGGSIGSDQTICYNSSPTAFTNVTSPSGESGTLEYQWQKSTTANNSGFSNISGATADTYTEISALTQTTWYKRSVKVSCETNWLASNVIQVAIKPIMVSTQSASLITETSATSNGNLSSICNSNANDRGVIWYPYTDTDKIVGGTDVTNVNETGNFTSGAFTASLSSLTVNTRYNARAHATNNEGTDYGSRVDFWTLANVPSAPTVNNPTTTTLDVIVNANSNPVSTEFVIHETSTDKFVQADGSLGVSAVWATAASWGTKTLAGLTSGTEYTFEVKARNGGNVETAYSTIASGTTLECFAGQYWTAYTEAVDNSWASVTYGNGLFVAIGNSGTNRVMTSPDGKTWTARTATESNNWTSITYGNGLFVAVALNGTNRVMTSPDGIAWTAQTASAANAWKSVTFGNGLFVAVSSDGANRVMTSPDGISWTAQTAASASTWRSITFGNGLFVAVATLGTNRVMTSPDGINWTSQTAAEANTWYSVTYGNGLFVAVASDGTNRVMKSPDGITWTAHAAAEANQWSSVTYGNGLFTAVAFSGTNRIMTSPDGITWTSKTALSNYWYSITYGNESFVAIASVGTKLVMTSDCIIPVITVTTQGTSIIATSTATGNGNITNLGSGNATNRGVIQYPYTGTDKIIGNADVTNVSENGDFGIGAFTASLTGLLANTRYNTRAHATNAGDGTQYGSRVDFWTLANVPDAPTVNNPTATTLDVTVNANSNPATTEFAIHETTQNKFVQGDGTLGDNAVWQTATIWGTKTIIALTTGSTYTFEVKARNGGNVETAYGASNNGTPEAAPTVTTQAATIITATSATGNGNITATNGVSPTNRGVIYYTFTGTDKINGDAGVSNADENGTPTFTTGAFTASLTGLSVNTRYNARAHATNTVGTGYGSRIDFWTLANVPDAPTVNNPTATTLDVTVNANSNPATTEFVIHETSTNNYVQANGTLGATAVWATATSWGTKTITGLTTGSTYTFEVKARNGNNEETVYGSSANGTPEATPTVTTQSVTTISTSSATGNGNITATNGVSPTNRGVIYYNYSGTDKIIGDAGVINADENGTPTFTTGAFTASLTGLSANTRYNARAHATNTVGTGYGSRIDFWTLANVPDAPTVNNPTATTLDVAVNANSNPATTEFVIHETSTNNYVQADGSLGATAVWATAASWGTKTITALTTGSTYTFEVKARNGGNVETAYGATTSETTCKNPTSAGSIGSSQFTCVGSTVNAFTSIADAGGYSGTLEYKWQKSTTGELTDFNDIASTNAATYNPVSVSLTTWYKRLAKVSCKTVWVESNVVKLTINSTIAVTNTNNSGVGSLRYAIENLCNNGVITFANGINGQSITLTTGTLAVDKNITFNNSNHTNGITIAGSGTNLTINAGKTLTIATGSKITVSGAIVNNAGTAGLVIESGASFIHNTANLQATAKRYLNNGWHLIGSPFKKTLCTVSNIAPAGGSLQIKPYTNGTNWQNNVTSMYTYLLPTTGYAVKPTANYTMTLAGNLYYSTLSFDNTVALTYNGTSATQSWNLLANPYTSNIDFKTLTKTNISQSLYIWDNSRYPNITPVTNTTYFNTFNTLTNVGVPVGTTSIIAPMQGFFVKAVYTTPKIVFTPASRTHSNAVFYKSYDTEILLRLKAETEQGADELAICRNESAKQGFEEYDSEKLLNGNPIEIYSYAKTKEKLTINTANANKEIIPLGINAEAGSKVKISSFGMETAENLYLEDRLKGKIISLSENTEYSFIADEKSEYGRFFIRFGNTNSGLTSSDISVTQNGSELSIIAQTGVSIEQIEIFTITGSRVYSAMESTNVHTVNLNLSPAMYLIRVRTSIETQNLKFNWK